MDSIQGMDGSCAGAQGPQSRRLLNNELFPVARAWFHQLLPNVSSYGTALQTLTPHTARQNIRYLGFFNDGVSLTLRVSQDQCQACSLRLMRFLIDRHGYMQP